MNNEDKTISMITPSQKCVEIADKYYDGHFTLLKFTTNWRFCFGTVLDVSNMVTSFMAYGETADEAIENAIKGNVNIDNILKVVEELNSNDPMLMYMNNL